MINDERALQPALQRDDRGQCLRRAEDLDVPSAAGQDTIQVRQDRFDRRCPGTDRMQVQPHAPDTALMHSRQLRVAGRRRIDNGDAACHVPKLIKRIEGTAIVGAVEARLHDHQPGNIGSPDRLSVIRGGGRRDRVAAPWGEGIASGLAEKMHVAVYGADRHGGTPGGGAGKALRGVSEIIRLDIHLF